MVQRDSESFWAKVDVRGPDECWPWTGARNENGYGRLTWNGTQYRAHRLAFEIARGPIPPGKGALHRCDFPPCCNPAHLFVGAPADNVADARAKGRWPRVLSEGARQLVRLLAENGAPQRRLAADFGVSQRTIGRAVREERSA